VGLVGLGVVAGWAWLWEEEGLVGVGACGIIDVAGG